MVQQAEAKALDFGSIGRAVCRAPAGDGGENTGFFKQLANSGDRQTFDLIAGHGARAFAVVGRGIGRRALDSTRASVGGDARVGAIHAAAGKGPPAGHESQRGGAPDPEDLDASS